jgi:putative hydrolase of the HAD superfamily|tara:strand:- start:178 stop:765 length:588 start_codon:yes stop_codon:yes gene_type:complete
MTDFISLKLGIEKTKAKEIQQEYFYKYDTSLNGLMKNYPKLIDPHEFLKYVHNINYDCLEKDTELREELIKLDVKIYCATNGSKEHAVNCMKKIGIDDLFEGKIMDIVDFDFKPKPNSESLKLMCDKFQIPTNEETVYIEDIAKNLSSDIAKDMIKVWFINEEPINNIDKHKNVIDYKIDNLALFLKKIRLLKEA